MLKSSTQPSSDFFFSSPSLQHSLKSISEKIWLLWLKIWHTFFFFRYFLQPRENGGKSVKVEELGSLRLNIVYTEDHVFPSEHYTPLRDLLLQSANVGVCAYRCVLLCVCFGVGTCFTFTVWMLYAHSSLFSLCRRLQLIFWGRCVERNKKPPFPLCVCFFTTARLCLSSAPSLTLKWTAHSKCSLTSFHVFSTTSKANTCHN